MPATPGVYRATYRDKATGELREASTWIATHWDPAKQRTVKEYGFDSATAAKQRRAELMADPARLSPSRASAASLTLDQLVALVVADYEMHGLRSLRAVRSKAKTLLQTFPGTTLARNIDDVAVSRHIRRMRAEKYQPATINRTLALLRRGFRLARRQFPGLVIPHFALLNESANVRQGFLSPEVFAQILSHIPADVRPAVQALHITGWRAGEIRTRKWSDIEGGFLLIRPGEAKNGKARAFPVAPELERILPTKAGPYIFGGSKPLSESRLRHAWEAARQAAGAPHALIHDFRRTAARDLIKAGVDRDTAKRILGHETDSIFTRYRIVSGDDLTNAGKMLSKFRSKARLGTDSERPNVRRVASERDTLNRRR